MEEVFLDPRKVVTGKNGRLFRVGSDGNNIWMAQVDTFNAKRSQSGTAFTPCGDNIEYQIPTTCSYALSFTEAVVSDEMIAYVLECDEKGITPNFDFVGVLKRDDGAAQRVLYSFCIMDGDLDIQNIVPGEVTKRNWNFRVNSRPKLLAQL